MARSTPKSHRGGRRNSQRLTNWLNTLNQNLRQQQPQPPQNQPNNQQNQNLTASVQSLIAEYSANKGKRNNGDYTGGNNPGLMKWQQQTDDNKAASYLAKLSKSDDEIRKITNDKWGFYDNPMQKMLLNMGLNDKPTVLKAKDFDALANATGEEVIYRGWGKSSDIDRFQNADYTHIGTGRYGDGLYFGSQSTASGYGSPTSRCMLSPTARVIDVNTLRAMMPKNGKLASALRYSGTTGSRQYTNDVGGEAQWALKLGYNVIDAGWCKCVLTRDALIVRGK